MLRQAQQPCFDKLSNHASTSSATMLRQAQHKRFDKLSNHTGAEPVAAPGYQAQQPCFDKLSTSASTSSATTRGLSPSKPPDIKLSNRASTSSATVLRQAQHKRFGRLSNHTGAEPVEAPGYQAQQYNTQVFAKYDHFANHRLLPPIYYIKN